MNYRIFFIIITPFILVSCTGSRPYVEVLGPGSSKTVFPQKKVKENHGDYYIVNGEPYYPLPDSMGFVETGKASWYGEDFDGRPTSSGEIYDMYKKTAAHKTLPLGTYVKVVNLETNRSAIVRINDRGPFVKGRVIDLSYGAATEIGMADAGIAEVKVIALGREIQDASADSGASPVLDLRDFETGEFTVQVGAFRDKNNALKLAERLRADFDYVNIMEYEDTDNRIFFRVHVSRTTTLVKAGEMQKRLEDLGFTEAFVLRI
jgi:rare lipoprotein A